MASNFTKVNTICNLNSDSLLLIIQQMQAQHEAEVSMLKHKISTIQEELDFRIICENQEIVRRRRQYVEMENNYITSYKQLANHHNETIEKMQVAAKKKIIDLQDCLNYNVNLREFLQDEMTERDIKIVRCENEVSRYKKRLDVSEKFAAETKLRLEKENEMFRTKLLSLSKPTQTQTQATQTQTQATQTQTQATQTQTIKPNLYWVHSVFANVPKQSQDWRVIRPPSKKTQETQTRDPSHPLTLTRERERARIKPKKSTSRPKCYVYLKPGSDVRFNINAPIFVPASRK